MVNNACLDLAINALEQYFYNHILLNLSFISQTSFLPYWYGGGELVNGNSTWPLQGNVKAYL